MNHILSESLATPTCPTFSYLDTSTMHLSGPFCGNCMNVKRWKITQLNSSGKLALFMHKITKNERCYLWKLQLQNGSLLPFTSSKETCDLLPLACSSPNCLSNKRITCHQKKPIPNKISRRVDVMVQTVKESDFMDKGIKTISGVLTTPKAEKKETLPAEMGKKKGKGKAAKKAQKVSVAVVKKEKPTGQLNSVTNVESPKEQKEFKDFHVFFEAFVPVVVKKHYPLLSGSKDEAERMSEEEMASFLAKSRDLLESCIEKSQQPFLNIKCRKYQWSTKYCSFCPEYPKQDFIAHVLSQKHIEKLMEDGSIPLQADFEAIIEVLNCAISNYFKQIFYKMPFYNGTSDAQDRMPEWRVAAALEKFRPRLSALRSATVEHVLQAEFVRFSEATKCHRCDVNLPPSEWLPHLLSQNHVEKIGVDGRFLTSWDISRLHELLVKMERIEGKPIKSLHIDD